MRTGMRALLGVVLLGLVACGEDTRTKAGEDTADSVAIDSLGAADGFGPYRGDIAFGSARGGALDQATWYHYWTFRLDEDSRIRLDATGIDGTDTYLYLYQWNGRSWVATHSNDDCRRGTYDSCLELDLRSGDYLALVSTYEGIVYRDFPSGDYRLDLTCQRGGCEELLCGVEGSRDVPTEFVTADWSNSYSYPIEPVFRTLADDPSLESAPGDERVVEEGDIYRVLSDGYLLNLNAYRGLQVIDVSKPDSARIVGRERVAGTPVEMYVYNDVAYVLLNNWRAYYGIRDDIRVDGYEGGVLVAIDVSNPALPRIIDRERVEGNIRTSRLVHGGGSAAIYVAATSYGAFGDDETLNAPINHTVVSSFSVGRRGFVAPVDQIDLGGSVADIQGTPEALLVATNEYVDGSSFTRVAVLDISSPDGRVVEGGTVMAAGMVSNKTNMDLRGGILRIVSGSTWRGTQTNHLETYDARDVADLQPIDHCEFGEGQSLFATLFQDDRAFFVTYLRVDPFHAFSIDESGRCEERAEFEVSGWNNFFRPVLGSKRLIGIGMNDEDGRTMSVSLYDISELDNTQPLVARAEVEANSSWSDATWDDRAFSVVEGAVEVQSRGYTETGLVLLPFQGWNEERQEYLSAVQVFTFSEETLTRRGLMVHGTPVQRTFPTQGFEVGNLSQTDLSLFDVESPDTPRELGRVELAPNYTDVLLFGDHAARLDNSTEFYGWWWGDRAELPASTVEIVSLSGDVDNDAALAEIEIPASATIERVGRHLVVINKVYGDSADGTVVTAIDVYDLTDPTDPVAAGHTETTVLQPDHYYYPMIRCIRGPCLPPIGGIQDERYIVGDAIVFVQRSPEESTTGESTRYWQRVTAHVLDLSLPSQPRFLAGIDLPRDEDSVNAVVDGARLWIGTKVPATVDDGTPGYASHRVRALDLTVPSRPTLGQAVNVPGQLFAVQGVELFSRDSRWSGRDRMQTVVSRAIACEGTAYQQATFDITDHDIQNTVLDGAGHLLVSHRMSWQAANDAGLEANAELSVLDLETLDSLGRFEVDQWADLREATGGRALFQIPGGLLVVNTELGWLPYAQAYFSVTGWPQSFHLRPDRLLFAAGRYGIYDFGLGFSNLF